MMFRTTHFVIFCIFMLLLPSMVSAQSWRDTKTAELVEKARANTTQVSIQQLKESIDNDDDILIFDVRTIREYEAAHVPDAYHIDRGLLEFAVWAVADDMDEEIFVYCRTGARAALASQRLQELGFTNVNSVASGAVDWTKSGYPVQSSILDERIMITPVPE